MNFPRKGLAALLLALLAASAAQAVEVAGVKLEDGVALQGSPLQLNGHGVRYKAIFKVYAAGLYLSRRAGTTEEVLAAPGPKRMSLTMLREIDATELGKLFARGVEDNSPREELPRLAPGLLRMGQVFAEQKRLQAGDTVLLDWLPGNGLVISVNGRALGEPFREPEFFNAVLRIWLGPHPADGRLKEALLGKAP